MGGWMSRKKESRILIQGLDAAGKTSLLYWLKLGEVVTTIPTIGFNVETVSIGNVMLTCWDLGGRDKIRPLYRHYYPNTDGIIFIIDSNDKERLDYAFDELMSHTLLEDELRGKVVMILANKQDLEGAMTPFEIENALLQKLNGNKHWPNQELFVFPCSVVNNTGIDEAMEYFANRLKQKSQDHESFHGLRTITKRAAENAKAANAAAALKLQEDSFSVKSFLKHPVSFFKSLLKS